jgi:hypothetical protein
MEGVIDIGELQRQLDASPPMCPAPYLSKFTQQSLINAVLVIHEQNKILKSKPLADALRPFSNFSSLPSVRP